MDILVHHIGGDTRHEVTGRAVEVALLIRASDLEMQKLLAGPVIGV
jgi:hypothetical protein